MTDTATEPLRVLLRQGAGDEPVLEFSGHLARYDVVADDNRVVATVVGRLVTGWLPANVAIDGSTVRWRGQADDIGGFERDIADGLNGAFIAVTRAPLPPRLYLDAGGQIPIVYDAVTRTAACSADGLLDDAEYVARLLPERIERLVGREGNGWISGTLTAHAGIERLLPNHYLDLASFTAHRHWPRPGFTHHMGIDTAVSRVADALAGYIGAMADHDETTITLTAGFDSRLLLCAAREKRERIRFATMAGARPGMDQIVAARLGDLLGLDHRLVPIVEADAAASARWDRRVGHSIREVNRVTHPTLLGVPGTVMLTGMYGETGRCRLYKQDLHSIDREPATVRFVLSRLTLPLEPELVANVERWLDPIRALPRSVVLDLAFNELKFGSWAMGQAPIQKAMRMSLAPFAQRVVLDAFMAVPPHEKGTSTLFERVGQRLWPEAMTIPVNRYGDWRDRVPPFAKLLQPERVRRMLRDRLARS